MNETSLKAEIAECTENAEQRPEKSLRALHLCALCV